MTEVIVSCHAGVCFGVKRALELVNNAINENPGKKIYSWGPLIHNPQVVTLLDEKGVHVIESADALETGDIVIIRSHGITKELEAAINAKGAHVIDATCPFVKNAQRRAEYLYKNGYEVIIFGEEEHPEVHAILSYTDYQGIVAADENDAVFKTKKVGIVSQTTRSKEHFAALCGKAAEVSSEVLLFNTICDATEMRQKDALDLARKVDFMIVVGGKNSANTRKLFELVSKKVPAIHIETEKELDYSKLMHYNAVGITAGASTPDFIIDNVAAYLKKIPYGG